MSSEQHENERPSAPPLCANNCGFYGSPANRNLCSKCYRECLKAEDAAAAAACIRTQQQQQISGPAAAAGAAGAADKPLLKQAAAEQPAAAAANTAPVRTSGNKTAGNSDKEADAAAAAPSCASEPLPTVTAAAAEAEAAASSPASEADLAAPPSPASAPAGAAAESSGAKGKSSRCHKCKKKVGLLGFNCRCGFAFCGEHRYADSHGCLFDYKAYEREQLRKQNNRVVADKLQTL